MTFPPDFDGVDDEISSRLGSNEPRMISGLDRFGDLPNPTPALSYAGPIPADLDPGYASASVRSKQSWTDYFLSGAAWAASRSKDPTTQVGCLLVGSDKEVLGTGYNGLPRGVRDLPERMERPAKYLWTSHAEENAIATAARNGNRTKGATAYVTHFPCARCARSLIQAGVVKVCVSGGKTSMPQEEFQVARAMFDEAGVEVQEWMNLADYIQATPPPAVAAEKPRGWDF